MKEVGAVDVDRRQGRPSPSHQSTGRKEVGTVRRLALILMGGALWLILAAAPALADGGPHVKTENNGSLGVTQTGVHYRLTPSAPYLREAGTQLGALRGGGFEEARIGDPFRYTVDSD